MTNTSGHYISRKVRIWLLLLACTTVPVLADAPEQNIKNAVTKAFPDASVDHIRPAPVAGVYEVVIGARIVYVTADGKFLFAGDLIDLSARQNLSEERRDRIILEAVNAVAENTMVVMAPKKTLRTITVFTDVDCPYCAKLHLEMPQLVKEGVKVRYIFFPRAGLGSDSFKRSVAVWCSADRVKAIGVAKAGGPLEMKTCANPVAVHLQLSQKLNLRGTPSIVLDDGSMVPGYVPADRLLAMLGLKDGGK